MHADFSDSLARFKEEKKTLERTGQTPKRTRIQLKRHRQNRIPEVQIQLDDMLTEVYSSIRMQAKKNLQYPEKSQVQLNNSVIRSYIHHIYGEYNLPDPVISDQFFSQSEAYRFCVDDENERNYTPKRVPSFHQQNIETPSGLRKSRSRTLDKILRMKKNFQQELGTTTDKNYQTGIDSKFSAYSNPSCQKKQMKSFTQAESYEQRKFPISKTKRLKIKIVKNMRSQDKKTSHLVSKTKYHYCLMCEAPLQDNFITKHEKECPQLQKLLKKKVLNKNQIIHLLNIKISELEEQILQQLSMTRGDPMKIQVKIKNIIERKNHMEINPADQVSIEDERQEMNEFMSELGVVKCWQKMDKLQWFKLLRARAKSDRPLENFSI